MVAFSSRLPLRLFAFSILSDQEMNVSSRPNVRFRPEGPWLRFTNTS
jgi:hypothetical protein